MIDLSNKEIGIIFGGTSCLCIVGITARADGRAFMLGSDIKDKEVDSKKECEDFCCSEEYRHFKYSADPSTRGFPHGTTFCPNNK